VRSSDSSARTMPGHGDVHATASISAADRPGGLLRVGAPAS
jgi:hypothetical protein